MPVADAAPRRRNRRYIALLASVSALALLAPGSEVFGLSLNGSANRAATSASAAAAAAAAQSGAAAAQQARAALNRSLQALQAMQAAQAAARNGALSGGSGGVVDGFGPGKGLQQHPGVASDPSLWTNASQPTETVNNGRSTVIIRQSAQRSILTWQKFDIGRNTTLAFDQSGGDSPDGNNWIALNRVLDPSGAPSQILGQITAQGHVYIINQNGIIFGGSSQVNVGTLVASTLGITNDQFNRGILSQANSDPNLVAPAFVGTPGHTAGLTVAAGATIDTISEGKVLLLGGNVTNGGAITTPKGQTILAAGDAVYLERNTAQESGGVRGIVANVENNLGVVVNKNNRTITQTLPGSGGTATNNGIVSVDEGDITLVGQNVTQTGVLTAKTSATLNGSIKLWARSDQALNPSTSVAAPNVSYRGVFGGVLTLGENSLTEVRPDFGATDSVLDPTSFKPSSVDLVGKTITMRGSATILAEGGNVSFRAAGLAIPPTFAFFSGTPLDDRPDDGSRLYLDSGAIVDVAGLANVAVPMERNSVRAELRGDEFADFPQLRNSPLRGQTIVVDRRVTGVRPDGTTWIGTAYGNVNGWINLVPFGTPELMTNGGSIRLESRGDVITRAGSVVTANGGSIAFSDGFVRTSQIVWHGRRYDIGEATPDMVDAMLAGGFVVDHARWGITENFAAQFFGRGGHFEKGYVQGAAAGQILITGHHAVLDGAVELKAGVGDASHIGAAAADGGKLSFGETRSSDRTMPNVTISDAPPPVALDSSTTETSKLPAVLADTVFIRDTLINDSGAKDVAVNSNQTVTLTEDASIELGPKGSFQVVAGRAVINGKIRVPAGDVSIEAHIGATPLGKNNTLNTTLAKTVELGSHAVIDVSGLWINLSNRDTSQLFNKSWVNGGNVTLLAEVNIASGSEVAGDGAVKAAAGSLIDVSSGGLVQANGQVATASMGVPLGNGGMISLIGNAIDFIPNPGLLSGLDMPKLGQSIFASELRGYGLGSGGSLAIAATSVQIGGDPTLTGSELYLDPSFFQSGGFSNYRIIGWNGVTVAPGSIVAPKASSFILPTTSLPASGASVRNFATVGFKPDQLRTPTSLALYAPNYGPTDTTNFSTAADTFHVGDKGVAGDIVIGAGAVIRTDPGATVDIRAARELAVFGTIEARGGTINLANDQESGIALGFGTGPSPFGLNPGLVAHRPNVTLWIDSSARLIASGLVETVADAVGGGAPISRVLDGGSVSLTGGNIVVQPGSVIDVSGGVGAFVPSTATAGRLAPAPVQLATRAGSITITPGNYLYFDPTLLVQPGDSSLQGASFAIRPVTNLNLAVQLPLAFNFPFAPYLAEGPVPPLTAGSRIRLREGSGGPSEVAKIGGAIPTIQHPEFSVFEDSLQRAGFDDLIFATTDGVVAFQSSVTLSARRSIQFLSRYIGGDNSVNATVNAPYVAFGGVVSTPGIGGDPAAAGSGTFTVNANLIDFARSTTFGVDPTRRSGDGLLARTSPEAGFAEIFFNSTGDIRFIDTSPIPNSPSTAAGLTTFGDVTFKAAQFYATTRSSFISATARTRFVVSGYTLDNNGAIVNPNATVTFLSNGNAADVPLSAGGELIVAAGHIVQGGVMRAPAGQITLTNTPVGATTTPTTATISLLPGSLTSVDVDGAVIPFGRTQNDTDWLLGNQTLTKAVPTKQITLSGPTIDVKSGAVVSASGGGDLRTFEFVSGPGGSKDVLAGRNVFAVLPSYRGPLPSDPDWGNPTQTSLTVGSSVFLSGIPGLAPGYYTLLPGHYALLPGAFRVTVDASSSDRGPQFNSQTADGSYLTAGYLRDQFSGARTSERWSTFRVTSGDVVRTQSQYNENGVSAFLAKVSARNNAVAPRLFSEPGRIQVNATSLLTFDGTLRTAPVDNGRGGQIDISSGANILITGSDATPVANTLVLRADQLSNLETESLLIGGVRQQTSQDGTNTLLNGSSVTVNATNVTVDTKGTEFTGAEIILLGKTSVTVKSDSIIRATGKFASAPTPDLVLDQGTSANPTTAQRQNDGAAILALSNGVKPNFRRGNSRTGTLAALGNVVINDGVVLDGGNSLLVDGAVINLAFGTTSKVSARSVQIGANHISLGQSPQGTGLALGLGALAQLSQIEDLTLRSRETIDLYGDFTFAGRSQLTLDAAGLIGTSNNGKAAKFSAGTVNLVNSSATAANAPVAGSGVLEINAADINIGGNVFIDGTTSSRLLASGTITSTSAGLFDVRHGALTMRASLVTAAPSVSRVIQAPNGTVTVEKNADGSTRSATNSGGARLQLIGQSISQNGNIALPGGIVVLQSTTGDVTFGSGSITSASGFSKDFFDQTRPAPAGRVDVIATGNVVTGAGAVIDVSSAGDAGTITITAGGSAVLQGAFKGQGGEGYRNGAFGLDVGTLTGFDSLNALLEAGSFDRERNFRVRNGDVVIGSAIRTHAFTLSTDNGAITMTGRIDASGDKPGAIRLSASGNVIVAAGGVLDASGAAADDSGRGGTVALETRTGVVNLQAGSQIRLGAGGADNGTLSLRVPRVENDIGAGNHLNGVVTGMGAVTVEAFKVYNNITTLASSGTGAGTLTYATIDADNRQFVTAAGTALRSRLAAELAAANGVFDTNRLHLTPGAEVNSPTTLTVTNTGNVNLANFRYAGEGGVLTLRAAGNLNINGNISDGFTTSGAADGQLLSISDSRARSWSYRLIGGADLTAGDVRQAHQQADVSIAAATLVRTGTGSIEIAAGRDVKFLARDSVAYTAGVGRDISGFVAPAGAAYGVNGGDVTLVAGGNITAAPSEELINAWLFRQGNLDNLGAPIPGRPTSWWIDYSQFQQSGVGALGGGNVKLRAGDPRSEISGNINNVSVVLPTTGLVNGTLGFTAGGGDLSIEAIGNINSGLYYVGQGIGDLRTNRSFGSARIVRDTNSAAASTVATLPIFPILALNDARMNLVAGGDITVHAIFNPTATIQAKKNADGTAAHPFAAFFTYTDNSAVSLTSVGGKAFIYGDILNTLSPSIPATSPQFNNGQSNALYAGTPVPDGANPAITEASLWPYTIVPPTLKITTFNGDIGFDGITTLYPASRGTLELLSAGAVRSMTPASTITSINGGITIADADPRRLPNPFAPDFTMAGALTRLKDSPGTDFATETDLSRERLHGTSVLHRGDVQPALIYAANGDINFNSVATRPSPIAIVSAKSLRMQASNDILDLQLLVQNVDPDDISLVRAGRDIRFASGSGNNATTLINIAGPGLAAFEAGRNVDLGNAQQGIRSIGNLRNPALPSDGASILVGAGQKDVRYADFANAYLNPANADRTYAAQLLQYVRQSRQSAALDQDLVNYFRQSLPQIYDQLVADFMQAHHPGAPAQQFQALPASEQTLLGASAWSKFSTLSKAEQAPVLTLAWSRFQSLPTLEQAPLVRQVFYSELRAAADQAAHSNAKDLANYSRGFAAIATLFPGGGRPGDIRMFSSQIQTLDGGDIQLLAPNGSVLLGVTQATQSNPQGAGIQTLHGGSIFSMSSGDIIVNQAAVHTLGGGDIVAWSTTGNIDAGRGAKTRRQVALAGFRTDANGFTTINPGSTSSGAGISTLLAGDGAKPGNVVLATPNGFVDAGDAGIRVSGNLIIAAVTVLNANNIQVQGTSVGIPTVTAPPVAALSAANNTAGANSKIAEPPSSNSKDQSSPSIIIVEFVGFGGGDGGDAASHDTQE